MVEYVRFDVSKEETAFCVEDGKGPARELGKMGMAVEVIEARQAHAVRCHQHNKTDAGTPCRACRAMSRRGPVAVVSAGKGGSGA